MECVLRRVPLPLSQPTWPSTLSWSPDAVMPREELTATAGPVQQVCAHRAGATSFQGEVPAPPAAWVAELASPAEPLPQGKVASYPELWLLFLAWPDVAIKKKNLSPPCNRISVFKIPEAWFVRGASCHASCPPTVHRVTLLQVPLGALHSVSTFVCVHRN